MDSYIENPICQEIFAKLDNQGNTDGREFVDQLDAQEISYLNSLLQREMQYAQSATDDTRLEHLNKVYEQLY